MKKGKVKSASSTSLHELSKEEINVPLGRPVYVFHDQDCSRACGY